MAVGARSADPARLGRPQHRRGARLHQPARPDRAALERTPVRRPTLRAQFLVRLRAVVRAARPRPLQRLESAVIRSRILWLATGVVLVAALLSGNGVAAQATNSYPPPVGHVFVINLENKGYDQTWGPTSAAPYLSQTLRAQGVLLSQYYGIGHNSLDNYLAQISGQGPNAETQAACQTYDEFVQTGTAPQGQAIGQGCVYPSSVPTLPGQLSAAGRSWKGYMEDMSTPCRHPQ